MTSAFQLRPVEAEEHSQALHLWQTVFGEAPGYFERYYEADADYRQGDTLGTWSGDQLVSTVHLCRRRVAWKGATLLCGGIANVATLPDFRRQGLSSGLLRQMIAKMEAESFDFSLLGTGVPTHYAALGWETIERPQATLMSAAAPPHAASWTSSASPLLLHTTYPHSPRPLQFDRSPAYFEGWVGWGLRKPETTLLAWQGLGYVVMEGDGGEAAAVKEWRAVDQAAERDLLQAASAEAWRRGQKCLWMEALPQYGGYGLLESLGTVEPESEGGGMIRRIHLSPVEYEEVRTAYTTGSAAWWTADGF